LRVDGWISMVLNLCKVKSMTMKSSIFILENLLPTKQCSQLVKSSRPNLVGGQLASLKLTRVSYLHNTGGWGFSGTVAIPWFRFPQSFYHRNTVILQIP